MSHVSGGADQAVRAFAFGEPIAGAWGAAWLAPGASPAGVVGLTHQAAAADLRLEGVGADEPWRLTAVGTELVLEGVTEPAWRNPGAPGEGFDQLCRVSGTVENGSGRRELTCLGWRGARPPAFDPSVGSFRLVAAWFEPEEGFALVAARPRRAHGQDEEAVEAVLFDPGAPHSVAEPRLSTTYGESGRPTRAGVELWIETEPDSDHLYPRRAVGEAVAGPVGWTAGGTSLQAQPFRWFSGGREGSGVYLLGNR